MVALTGALALFTLWLVFETRRLVGEAVRTSERQAEEMKESLAIATKSAIAAETAANAALVGQRPWISCEVAVVGPITYSSEGDAQFRFRITAKNVGHSPAMGMRLHVHINLLSPQHELSLVHALRHADQERGLPAQMKSITLGDGTTLPYSDTGVLLFPGQEHSVNYLLPLSRKDIEASCEGIKPHTHFFPELVGLVTYTYPLALVRAYTGFIAVIRRAHRHEEIGTAFGLGEDVAEQDIKVSEHTLWGSFAS